MTLGDGPWCLQSCKSKSRALAYITISRKRHALARLDPDVFPREASGEREHRCGRERRRRGKADNAGDNGERGEEKSRRPRTSARTGRGGLPKPRARDAGSGSS